MASVMKVKTTYDDGRVEIKTIGPNNNSGINQSLDYINTEMEVDKQAPIAGAKPVRFEMYCEEDEGALH